MREGTFAVKSSDAGCPFFFSAKVLNSQSERPSALPIHAEQRPGGLYSLDAATLKHTPRCGYGNMWEGEKRRVSFAQRGRCILDSFRTQGMDVAFISILSRSSTSELAYGQVAGDVVAHTSRKFAAAVPRESESELRLPTLWREDRVATWRESNRFARFLSNSTPTAIDDSFQRVA